MNFLEQIEQYRFLTEETKAILRDAFDKNMLSEKDQTGVIAICEKTKKDLEAEEQKMLAFIEEEQLKLLQATYKLERDIHTSEERFDRKQDTAEITALESQFS